MRNRLLIVATTLWTVWGLHGLPAARAEDPSPSVWTRHGPTAGGAIEALEINAADPNIVYVAGTFGGGCDSEVFSGGLCPPVYKSVDGGATWSPSGLEDPEGHAMTALSLALAPGSSGVVYVGSAYHGVFKTTDGGRTWSASGLDGQSVQSLAIDPSHPGSVFAGTDTGTWRSTGGGEGWARIDDLPSVTEMVFAPGSDLVYAGTTEGPFRSHDRGQSWIPIGNGLGGSDKLVQDLAIDPTSPSVVYMATGTFGGSRLVKSTDHGESWSDSDLGLGTVDYFTQVVVDPSEPSTLYAGVGTAGSAADFTMHPAVFKSTDSGGSWSPSSEGLEIGWVNVSKVEVSALELRPGSPSTLLAATWPSVGGVFATTDGAGSWVQSSDGFPANARALAVAVDPKDPEVVYAGGSGGVQNPDRLYRSVTGGQRWVPASDGLPSFADVTSIAVDPLDTSTVYAATQQGLYRSTDGAKTWGPANMPRQANGSLPAAHVVAVDPDGQVWVGTGDTRSITVSVDGSLGHLYVSTDRGATFVRQDIVVGASVVPVSGVTSIAFGREGTETVVYASVRTAEWTFAGSASRVFKQAGVVWEDISAGLPPDVNSIAVDARDGRTLWAAAGGSAPGGGVFTRPIGSLLWERVGFPDDRVASVAVSPTGALYAAVARNGFFGNFLYTEIGSAMEGAYVSVDGGGTWTEINSGLLDHEVLGIRVHGFALSPDGERVYAATYAGVGSAAGV